MSGRELLLQDLRNPKNWKKTCNKRYKVHVCMPVFGTRVTNFLEGQSYITDQRKPFVIRGTVGECWVIDTQKLLRSYSLQNKRPLTLQYLQQRIVNGQMGWICIETLTTEDINWAFYLDPRKYGKKAVINFPVQTSWGTVLLANRPEVAHGIGDFLICADRNVSPNLQDVWVVNGEIFPKTYDTRPFTQLFRC